MLSEFAGAARELRQAYLINPHDIDGLKETMVEAMEAPDRVKARRMRLLRRQVFEHDIDHWAKAFLEDLERVTHADVDWPTRPLATAGPGPGHDPVATGQP